MNSRTAILLLLTALAACARSVPLTAPVTHRGLGWIAAEQEAGTFLIIADDAEAGERAVKELCDVKKYICFGPTPRGEALMVTRQEKKR